MKNLSKKKRKETLILKLIFVFFIFVKSNIVIAEDIGPIKLNFKESERSTIEPAVRKSLAKALSFYKKEYGLTLTRPIELIASQDSAYIARQWHTAVDAKYHWLTLDSLQLKACKSRPRIAADIGVSTLRICFNSPVTVNSAWFELNQDRLDIIIVHELMHLFQAQL